MSAHNNLAGRGKQVGPNPVVSVRLRSDIDERLTVLADRTRRSRSTYVREALERMLPVFEALYWDQQMERHKTEINERFAEMVQQMAQDLDLSGSDGR